jgi:hypothetical protein
MTPSPLQTAQDLRRSAQLVRTHGYARYNYVAEDGTLCAMGAVGIATGLYVRIARPYGIWDFEHAPMGTNPAGSDRLHACAEALAPLLSLDCKGSCTGSTIHKYVEAYHEKLAKSPVDIVYHYNDFICEGGEELALLLIQAAEKLEADLP